MKLSATLFSTFIIGIQTVSACGESLSFNIDTGISPLLRSIIALIIIFIELILLFKFSQWLFYKKDVEQAKRTARKVIYGLFLIPSTILFFSTVNVLPGFLYTTNCIPTGTTITIPEINYSTTTLKDRK